MTKIIENLNCINGTETFKVKMQCIVGLMSDVGLVTLSFSD